MINIFKNKIVKFIGDAGLTLIANCVSMVTLQMVIFPAVSKYMTEDDFGNVIFWYTAFNFIASVVGSSLSNLRLRNQGRIHRNSYHFLLIICMLLSTVGISVFYLIYNKNAAGLLYTIIIVFLTGIKNYYIVAFRLELKFNKVLTNNILQAVGNFIGLGFYFQGGSWYYILLLGEIFSLSYILMTTSLWKEKISASDISVTVREYIVFILLTLSTQLILYADRFVLKFVSGNSSLTSYYIATNGTKVLSVCVSASSSVVLSYLSKMDKQGIKKVEKLVFVLGGVFLAGSIFVNYLCSEVYVWVLYQNYWNEVQPYIWSISVVSAVNMLIIMIKPFTIRFVEQKKLVLMESVCMLIQVFLTIGGAVCFGIFGVILARGISFTINAIWIVCLFRREMDERSWEYENNG